MNNLMIEVNNLFQTNNVIINHSQLIKKESNVCKVAMLSLTSSEPEETKEDLFRWGFSIISNKLINTANDFVGLLEETDQFIEECITGTNSKTHYEVLQENIKNYITELSTLNLENNYNLADVCEELITLMKKYTEELNKEFQINDELNSVNYVIQELTTIKENIKQAEAEAKAKAEAEAKLEKNFTESLKEEIKTLFVKGTDSLFTKAEAEEITTLTTKIADKKELSLEEMENLLCFIERQKSLEDGLIEILKKKALYEHGFATKNFVSIIGAAVAGAFAGPGAAFAVHNVISTTWQNFISDTAPANRTEQIAALLANGAIGYTTGGIAGGIANTMAQITEDEASHEVSNVVAAASLSYLTHLTGTSPFVAVKIGLVGLIALKGKQILYAIKNDLISIKETFKNPASLPSAAFGAITKIARDAITAITEKKWEEVTALSTAIILSFGTLIVGASLGNVIGVALFGIYAVNRIFHSENFYKGEATLANNSFRKWVAEQAQLTHGMNIESLCKILQNELSQDEYKKTAKAITSLGITILVSNNSTQQNKA